MGEPEDKNLAEEEGEGEADQLMVEPPAVDLPLWFLILTTALSWGDFGATPGDNGEGECCGGKPEPETAGAGEEVEVPDDVEDA